MSRARRAPRTNTPPPNTRTHSSAQHTYCNPRKCCACLLRVQCIDLTAPPTKARLSASRVRPQSSPLASDVRTSHRCRSFFLLLVLLFPFPLSSLRRQLMAVAKRVPLRHAVGHVTAVRLHAAVHLVVNLLAESLRARRQRRVLHAVRAVWLRPSHSNKERDHLLLR